MGQQRMILRYPAVSRDHISFVYAGDIWVVSKEGGKAWKLTSARGEETYPRFSPDGRWLAFSGSYAGSQDLYVALVTGGVPQRLTFHPTADRLVDWLPDNLILFASTRLSGRLGFRQLFRLALRQVEIDGCPALEPDGSPRLVPLRMGAYGHARPGQAPDTWHLAFQTVVRGFSRFKGYRGGLAPEILLVDLKVERDRIEIVPGVAVRNLTTDAANDSHPMWHPDRQSKQLFFLSDRKVEGNGNADGRRYNLWVLDDPWRDAEPRPLTGGGEFDLRSASIGPEDLVWEQAGEIYRVALADVDEGLFKPRKLDVEIHSDRIRLMPRWEAVGDQIRWYDLSADGEKTVFEARGQIFLSSRVLRDRSAG